MDRSKDQSRAMGVSLMVLLHGATIARSEPFKPAEDSYVVEKLPKSLLALQKSPPLRKRGELNVPQTISLAREYLEIAQRTSDAAFARYAEELLTRIPHRSN